MTFTAPDFQVVTSWDNAINLALIDPQPASPGVMTQVFRTDGEGKRYRDGYPIVEWRYGFLSVAQFASINTQLGLSMTTISAKVTLRTVVQSDFATYANYNALAHLPEPDIGYQYYGGRYLNVVYVFSRLVAI